MSKQIAIIVPTIRPEQWERFMKGWHDLFEKHQVNLFKVDDSKDWPWVIHDDYKREVNIRSGPVYKFDWLFNKTDACRNAGFYEAAKAGCDIFISLDDDVLPIGDPIQDHLDLLGRIVSPTWMSTAQDWRVRGIPTTGEGWPVCLSHGVWKGTPDFDAPTQFLYPNEKDIEFNKTNIPKGVLFPLCAMNFAFTREMLPWVYQAPMGPRLAEFGLPAGDRFADIWAGVVMKLAADENKLGVVTGFATVNHTRASNVFTNLRKESIFLEANESFASDWQDDKTTNEYVLLYRKQLKAWQQAIGA